MEGRRQNGRTVEQLVDEHEIILDALLVQLAEVAARDLDEAVEEFEDKRRGCVTSDGSSATGHFTTRKPEGEAHFVTPTTYTLFIRTWKNDVEPRVMMGERMSGLEMTWIRNTSEIERLSGSAVTSPASRPMERLT
jgi:hypothetical protein